MAKSKTEGKPGPAKDLRTIKYVGNKRPNVVAGYQGASWTFPYDGAIEVPEGLAKAMLARKPADFKEVD